MDWLGAGHSVLQTCSLKQAAPCPRRMWEGHRPAKRFKKSSPAALMTILENSPVLCAYGLIRSGGTRQTDVIQDDRSFRSQQQRGSFRLPQRHAGTSSVGESRDDGNSGTNRAGSLRRDGGVACGCDTAQPPVASAYEEAEYTGASTLGCVPQDGLQQLRVCLADPQPAFSVSSRDRQCTSTFLVKDDVFAHVFEDRLRNPVHDFF